MGLMIEQLLNTNYVKYDRMIEIVSRAFAGSRANELNIYIDMYSMIKPLYTNKVYDINDYSSVTSCIVNMCAHYREFFWTRFKVSTKFFIVYSKNTPYINNQFYPDYNGKNIYAFNSNKLVDDMIANNIGLLETLCQYLPDIHFIKGTFETGVIIYDLICRNEVQNNSPHMVITKDVYNYQLVSMRNNIIILRPKKSNGQDLSYYINQNNLYRLYMQSRKADYSKFPGSLSPGLLSLLMALTSVKERDIKSLLNVRSALSQLSQAVGEMRILNGYNSDIQSVCLALGIDEKLPISSVTFEHRFKAIDIQFQHSVFINTAECKEITLNNLYDPDGVRAINNKYFKLNPLDLNRL